MNDYEQTGWEAPNGYMPHVIVRPAPPQDSRPFWLRLLSSLRLRLRPGKTFRRPVERVTIEGGAEF